MSAQPPSIHEAALGYARLQWSVIPIRAHDKRPLTRWLEFQRRLATEQEIDAWYQRWPTANVGVVTGTISGIVVLDIDPRHGGSRSLARWEAEHGPLPASVEARSGGGGRHIYFRHPGGIVHNRVAIAPGIDLRGDGGCIVAPPSIHSSGNAYAWLGGQEPEQVIPAEMPGWLLGLVRGDSKNPGHSMAYWRRLVGEGVAAGMRNNTIASLTGHLLWRGVDANVVGELLLCWNRVRCSPPLDDDEVMQTVQNIIRLHRQDAAGESLAPG